MAQPRCQKLVTPEPGRLLNHWRNDKFGLIRAFFCLIEAVETATCLPEVGPKMEKTGAKFPEHLKNANAQANPELFRLALKLATGSARPR